MQIHDALKKAMEPYKGARLRTQEIHKILHQAYPSINLDSVLPNDHAEGNRKPCFCAKTDEKLFNRVRRGVYEVL